MNKKILITGAKGFIGSSVCRYFKDLGYQTYGIGHGGLSVDESKQIGLDFWIKNNISIDAIREFDETFDLIVHCGGSGSVGFSVENPYQDFKKTVDGTLEVLEYIRLYNKDAHLIYPSSPAVQGECEDAPIREEYVGKPASPYGYHKKIAEDLCRSYSEKYSIRVSIIRLFSVYGRGLRKQLLWDAYHKIKASQDEVIFWGTGDETRDFMHIDDVISLMERLVDVDEKFVIVNGGTGIRSTIRSIIEMLQKLIDSRINIRFNNQVNIGNPIYYLADLEKLQKYNFQPKVKLEDGIKDFIEWVGSEHD